MLSINLASTRGMSPQTHWTYDANLICLVSRTSRIRSQLASMKTIKTSYGSNGHVTTPLHRTLRKKPAYASKSSTWRFKTYNWRQWHESAKKRKTRAKKCDAEPLLQLLRITNKKVQANTCRCHPNQLHRLWIKKLVNHNHPVLSWRYQAILRHRNRSRSCLKSWSKRQHLCIRKSPVGVVNRSHNCLKAWIHPIQRLKLTFQT